MTFAWPHLLWLLAAPAALLVWELVRRRTAKGSANPKILRAEAGAHHLSLAAGPAARQGRRRLWLAAGLALAVVALARPQWGRIEEPLFDQSREIVLAVDLSRSMLTPDVPPTRLDRAKLLIESLLDRLAGERVGMIVFSGTAFLQSPLSADYEMLREFLPTLGPDFLPEAGTNYGAMIDTAAAAFADSSAADRYLIVLSDGGATDENWRDHVAKLKKKGVRVIGLGIGTGKGGFIPDVGGGFMKDERGAVVLATLESDTLRELAKDTGGAYRDAGEWVDLGDLLKSTVEAGQKGHFVETHTVRYIERFQWALAPALLCLLLSFWREFPVRPKPRDMKLAGAPVLLLLVLCLLSVPSASGAADAAGPPAPAPSALLGRIVGRLSTEEAPPAPDWAELGHETLTWGQGFKNSQQPVPPGPVRDALSAVDAGSALDAKAADWPKMRADLEALLRKPEDQKQNQPPPQKKPPQDKPQDKKKEKQDQGGQQKPQPSQQSQGGQPQNQNQPQDQPAQPPQDQTGQAQPSAASKAPSGAEDSLKLNPPAKPPSPANSSPPSGATQQIGGVERRPPDAAEANPELAIPLQKLEQVRSTDSPAALFKMIENNEPQPPSDTKGKPW